MTPQPGDTPTARYAETYVKTTPTIIPDDDHGTEVQSWESLRDSLQMQRVATEKAIELYQGSQRELTAALARVDEWEKRYNIAISVDEKAFLEVRAERDTLRRERDRTVTDFRNLAETLRFAEAERDEARKELAEERALIAEWRDALKQIAHDGNDAQRRADDALSIEKENA